MAANDSEKRRPRGNYIICGGKYWVGWGPRAPLPDKRTGLDVCVRAEPDNPESTWVTVWGTDEVVPHPDYPPLTLEQALEVIDGLCKVLSEYTMTYPPLRR